MHQLWALVPSVGRSWSYTLHQCNGTLKLKVQLLTITKC